MPDIQPPKRKLAEGVSKSPDYGYGLFKIGKFS